MKKKFKKGFTIVELVIVIAVIGILSAVLIPTFSGLIKSSKVSADQVVVRNMNTVLETEELRNNNKASNMHQAIEICSKHGYVPSRLVPSKDGYKIAWNQDTRRFTLVSDNDEVVQAAESAKKTAYWIVSDHYEKGGYSIYLSDGYTGPTELTDINTGLDVGNNTNIKKITYTRPASEPTQRVIIRTGNQGLDLIVEAPNDRVEHYAHLLNLDVNTSEAEDKGYFEYGTLAGRFSVEAGNVVITAQADLNEVKVDENAPATTKVVFEANSKVGTLVVDSDKAQVEVKPSANVGSLVADEENTNVTIPSSVVVEKVEKTFVTTYQELQAALDNGDKYIVLLNDINCSEITSITKNGILDGEGHTLTTSANRGIWIDAADVTATVKNLKIVVTGTTSYPRGIQLNSNLSDIYLTLENVDATSKYYALNICAGVTGKVTMYNSKLTGWAAINLWSSIDIEVHNSELVGKSISKNEGFATICFEADTTSKTDMKVSDAKVVVYNSKIVAGYNYSSGTGYQAVVGYNYTAIPDGANHNSFVADGCEIVYEGTQDNILLVYDYVAISNQSTNVTVINGRTIESDSWYCYR